MATSTALRSSVRAAFGALVDYAGLFPPAQLALSQAASEYQAARAGTNAWMLGRFIVPAPRLEEAMQYLEGPFSVIVDPNVDALEAVANLRRHGADVESLEISLARTISPPRANLSAAEILDIVGALEADVSMQNLRDVPAFIEVPRSAPWDSVTGETLDALARFGLQAKVRCGGVTADAFPSVTELAAFIGAAVRAHVPFKATAGLHHPVRHRDAATGFPMHGFLNLIAASALAAQIDSQTLESVVAEEEPTAFRFDNESFWWRDERVGLDALTQTRRCAFVGYGSCSFGEPVEDLTALGILPQR